MKKLILFMFLASICWGQNEYVIRPVVSTTTIASCVTTSASTTVSATARPFGSVVAGQQVFGPGILWGTTVSSLGSPSDSIVILSQAATASATVSLQFGYYTSAAYTSGDWVGFPFKAIPLQATEGGTVTLVSAEIVDASDGIGATDIVFFSTGTGSQGLDNAAAAVPAADEAGLLGIVSLTTVTDVGAVKILTKDDINLALPIAPTNLGSALWARLIARTGPTLSAITNYRVRLRFK